MPYIIPETRLISNKLLTHEQESPAHIVRWMGAMQAQDYTMAKWAVGVRLKNGMNHQIETAFNKGEFIRTHVMRPTWHFVAPEDLRWMLNLSAQRIKASAISRDKNLEITEKLYTQTNQLIEKIVRDKSYLTREEIGIRLEQEGITISPARMTHFMMRAEVEAIVCSGPVINKKQTYALLDERILSTKSIAKEEALALLVQKYFQSHSPASLQDFVWWSGLSVTEAKKGMESIRGELVCDCFPDKTLFIHQAYISKINYSKTIHLLPAFDEYIIGYKDRSTILEKEYQSKAFTKNGMFFPTIVSNGMVIGTWKKNTQRPSAKIEIFFFPKINLPEEQLLETAKNKYQTFLKRQES